MPFKGISWGTHGRGPHNSGTWRALAIGSLREPYREAYGVHLLVPLFMGPPSGFPKLCAIGAAFTANYANGMAHESNTWHSCPKVPSTTNYRYSRFGYLRPWGDSIIQLHTVKHTVI